MNPRVLPAIALVLIGGATLNLGLFGAPLHTRSEFFTTWMALVVQALPFLLLGTVLSGIVSQIKLDLSRIRWVPLGAAAGFFLPTCECAAVPLTRSLINRGLKPAVGYAFMLAAPAINPVVLVATAVAFDARMVAARFIASFLAAIVIAWLWHPPIPATKVHHHGSFSATVIHDFVDAASILVWGAAVAAFVKLFAGVGGDYSFFLMGALAFVMSMCSEADAFVAASFHVPPSAQLAFLVVGPMIDLKLMALHAAIFGKRFALRFAPLVFLVTMVMSAVVGALLLN